MELFALFVVLVVGLVLYLLCKEPPTGPKGGRRLPP